MKEQSVSLQGEALRKARYIRSEFESDLAARWEFDDLRTACLYLRYALDIEAGFEPEKAKVMQEGLFMPGNDRNACVSVAESIRSRVLRYDYIDLYRKAFDMLTDEATFFYVDRLTDDFDKITKKEAKYLEVVSFAIEHSCGESAPDLPIQLLACIMDLLGTRDEE